MQKVLAHPFTLPYLGLVSNERNYPVFTPTYDIFARTADGQTIECFRWTRDEASGLRRAERDAKEFGVDAVQFWAVPVELYNPAAVDQMIRKDRRIKRREAAMIHAVLKGRGK